MRRLTITSVASIAAAVSLPMAIAQAAPHAHAASGTKLEIRHTGLGGIIANGRGSTLYMFTRDSVKHDRCVAISGCTGVWPVVTSNGRPRLGAGVRRSLVGTIKLPGGGRQVT